MPRINHALLFIVFGLVLILAEISGCGKKEEKTPLNTTVSVGINQNPNTLDPIKVVDVFSGMVAASLHAGLVLTDTNGEIVPVLAKAVRMSPDGMECQVVIDPTARFWDGGPVTASDVRYSIERLRASPHPFKWIYGRISGVESFDKKETNHIEGIEIIDEKNLRIRFSQCEPEFPKFLASGILTAVVKGRTNGPALPFDVDVVGAGPFKPGKFFPGVSFEMLANAGFPKHENVERLIYRVIENPQNQIEGIAKGDLDVLRLRGPMLQESCRVGPSGGLELTDRFKDCRLVMSSGNELLFLMINWGSAKLTDFPAAERRKFVDLAWSALAPDMVAKRLYLGQASAAAGVVPPSVLIQTRRPGGGGYRPSRAVKLTLSAPNDPDSRRMAGYVQTQLRGAGIEMEIVYLEAGLLVQKILGREYESALFWVEQQVPSVGAWTMFWSPSSPFKVLGEAVEGIDAAVERARGEIDATKRRQAYMEVVGKIDETQSAWVPIVSRASVFVTSKRCEGLFIDGDGAVFFHQLRVRE